jgi:hypothetical protein
MEYYCRIIPYCHRFAPELLAVVGRRIEEFDMERAWITLVALTEKTTFRFYVYWPVKLICPNCQHEDCEALREPIE